MKVKSIMTRDVATCRADEPMSVAAARMWDGDCGVLPVVSEETGALEGVITDRDICMAALLSARPLAGLLVADAMSHGSHSCTAGDDLREVHRTMREYQVRRLPVVNEDLSVVGMVSLCDLAVEAYSGRGPAATRRQREAGRTLAAICEHHELEPA